MSRFNARDLALRDPALAALMGATPSDFGFEASEAAHQSQFGWDAPGSDGGFFGQDGGFFGQDDFGYMGADAPPATAVPRPTEAQALALWHSHHAKMQHERRRTSLLNPNQGSAVKVERFSLSVKQAFNLGTATALNMTKQPDTELRAQRVAANAPSPAFATLDEIKVGNISVTQGDSMDAFSFQSGAWGVQMDLPTLSPANRVTILGNTTTLVPPGFNNGASFPFIMTFFGPASMTG